ncbi:MAG TPA: helix-turn-helix domain-containing protein [Chloroflexia bacterium]|nr:helix-turn-helix domain-containing protein [Chloroflexia bacterium]
MVDSVLTVRDLISTGGPLDPSEVLAGQAHMLNAVSWVVSLRPFPPAFPQMKGGEFALVAAEHLARLDPPTTLSSVIRHLASRRASGVAVRGEVDAPAISASGETGLPLIRLPFDAPLHDIEQAIMRECALHQARREMLPPDDPTAWVDDLLAGRFSSAAEAQSQAKRQGYNLASHYAIAHLTPPNDQTANPEEQREVSHNAAARLNSLSAKQDASLIARPFDEGVAVLLAQGSKPKLLSALDGMRLACGISTERPLAQAPGAWEEARLAALASAKLHAQRPTHYAALGAGRLLMLLYRDHPGQVAVFVEDTLGPLLRHDARSATPLLPTLRAFIEHGGRLRETAAEIYVHRNTLAYRLDRAAEILHTDLKNPDARLAIELALRALPLVGD